MDQLPAMTREDILQALQDAIPEMFKYRITGRRGQQGSRKDIQQMRLLIDISIPRNERGSRELTEQAIQKLVNMIWFIVKIQQEGELVQPSPNDLILLPIVDYNTNNFIMFNEDSEIAQAFLTVFGGNNQNFRYFRYRNKIYALPAILRANTEQDIGMPVEGVVELFIDTIIPNTYNANPTEIADNTTRRRQINEIRANRAIGSRIKPIERNTPPITNDENVNIIAEEQEIKEIAIIDPQAVVDQVVERKLEPEEEYYEQEELAQLAEAEVELPEVEAFGVIEGGVRVQLPSEFINPRINVNLVSDVPFDFDSIPPRRRRGRDDDIIDRDFDNNQPDDNREQRMNDQLNRGRRELLNNAKIIVPITIFLTTLAGTALSLYRGVSYPVSPDIAEYLLANDENEVNSENFEATMNSMIAQIRKFVSEELLTLANYAVTDLGVFPYAVYLSSKSYVLAMSQRILASLGYVEGPAIPLTVDRITEFKESAAETVQSYDENISMGEEIMQFPIRGLGKQQFVDKVTIELPPLTNKDLYQYFEGEEVQPPIVTDPVVENKTPELFDEPLYFNIYKKVAFNLGYSIDQLLLNQPSYRVIIENPSEGIAILNSPLPINEKMDKFFEYLTNIQRKDIDENTELYKNFVLQTIPQTDGELYISRPDGLVNIASTMIYWLLYPFKLTLESVAGGNIFAIGLMLCLVSYQIFYIFKLIRVEPPALTAKYSDFCKNVKDTGLYVAEKTLDIINTGFSTFGPGGMLAIAAIIIGGIFLYKYNS